jgi:cellulose synthase/poly-beta-1,6-N-acetylglucosamine synthase-like glycosyltransferase
LAFIASVSVLAISIDADTLIEPDALLRMARPFLHGDDVVAAGGTSGWRTGRR